MTSTTTYTNPTSLHVSGELLQKYNTSGPRYTSYPTVPEWSDTFDHAAFVQALGDMPQPGTTPLSLYTHIPFCAERCLFCGCNVVITQQTEQAEKYLPYLFKEIDLQAQAAGIADTSHEVVQYHWGGGTPTYLSSEQMRRVFNHYKKHYTFAPDAELSIEVDPRVTTDEQLATLRELGFNRISLGVQDFDNQVQEAINRLQSAEQTRHMIDHSRALGFDSVNFDLIYGLPHQHLEQFRHTVDTVIEMNPDRIALYNFAYVPWMAPHQKQLDEATMPDGNAKFEIFSMAIAALTGAGYVYIGMDHFAKPDDELYLALEDGSLHRNFMGYTTKAGTQMLSAGVSAISGLHNAYAQNQRKLAHYYEALDANHLATMRGCNLTADDHLRRDIIQSILCQGVLNFDDFSSRYQMDFKATFADALETLSPMVDDDLIVLDDTHLALKPLGRIFSRNVAMVFDAYLPQRQAKAQQTFSKTL